MVARLASGVNPVVEASVSWDKNSDRTYQVTYLVEVDPGDGPGTAANCPGLPTPYNWYINGNDQDLYAWCYWAQEVTQCGPSSKNEPPQFYQVKKTFSSKPEDLERCRQLQVEDPLLEPPKISGNFQKYTEEAVYDLYGTAITYSSWERIRGPQNEWDKNRISIKVEQPCASPYQGYQLPATMVDCVNVFPMWGFPPRTIKLSSAPWEKKYYGPCIPYYVRTLEFDVRYSLLNTGIFETWDRYILDESTKVLSGQWQGTVAAGNLEWVPTPGANPQNPTHFIKSADVPGNLQKIVLNGAGLPAGVLAPTSAIFMSIQFNNTGNPLSNNLFWVPMKVNPSTIGALPNWDSTVIYPIGNMVVSAGLPAIYISYAPNNLNHDPLTSPAFWVNVGFAGTVTNAGNYNPATTYSTGQYVNGYGSTGNAGYIFVQKYPSVDFTLLNIPLSF